MSSMADRLRHIRAEFGLSQREMAEKLGVGMSTYQSYETSRIPKGQVFIRLAELGFDGNWLLTGEGRARRDEKAASPAKQPIAYDQTPPKVSKYEHFRMPQNLGVTRRLRLPALMRGGRRGIQGALWVILQCLFDAAPKSVELGDLLAQIQRHFPEYIRADLESDLYGLIQEGWVEGQGKSAYRLVENEISMQSHTVADGQQHILQGMTYLANEVALGLESRPRRAHLWTGRLRVKSGTLAALYADIQREMERQLRGAEVEVEGEGITLILALAADGPKSG